MTHERPWYRWYVLFILTLIYAFSYVDRQIVTILAPYLKKDMGISDAQLGLLYGTSFALFSCVFGIPLARLADGWSRVRTLALGLSFWSLMTAMSGLSRNFAQLGVARIGVGVGEASATPAAVSLLGDYFERARRGTVLALYSVGVYVGAGASLAIGGSIVSWWEHTYGKGVSAPFGLSRLAGLVHRRRRAGHSLRADRAAHDSRADARTARRRPAQEGPAPVRSRTARSRRDGAALELDASGQAKRGAA